VISYNLLYNQYFTSSLLRFCLAIAMEERRIARLLNQAHSCGLDVPGLEETLMDYMWADDAEDEAGQDGDFSDSGSSGSEESDSDGWCQ
jgi:hypothetical protein